MRVFVAIGMRVTGTARAPVVIVIVRIGTVLWGNSYLLRQTIRRIISSRSVERILGKPKEREAALQMNRAIVTHGIDQHCRPEDP